MFRSVRRDLRPLAVLSFLGIPAQALLGGVTVLTGLNPWTVAAHFLLSMVLVAVATMLWLRSREPGVGAAAAAPSVRAAGRWASPPSPPPSSCSAPSSPAAARTAATRTPPGRTGFDPELVSQLHADVVFLLIGLTVALLVALYATDSPGRVRRAARDLLIVQLAQGVVGYVQYFTDLPIALVLLHMLGAVLITAFTARLVWSVRGPASELPLDSPAQPAAATR